MEAVQDTMEPSGSSSKTIDFIFMQTYRMVMLYTIISVTDASPIIELRNCFLVVGALPKFR
jgi:hypothetical protein